MKDTYVNFDGKKLSMTIIPLILAMCLVFTATVVGSFLISEGSSEPGELPTESTAIIDETTTVPVTTVPVIETTVPATTAPQEVKVPKVLAEVMEKGGYTVEELDFDQLVVVESEGTGARVMFFEKEKNKWDFADGMSTVTGYVGSQGVSADASEYASYTPEGLYSIGTGFGIMDDPGTGLDYFKVTQDSYWVDDPNSAYYNQHIEGTENKDWQSAEHLASCSPEYNYAVFIEYNVDPVVPGKGSAFFLHVGNSPTAGCVAIPQDSMIDVLCWMQSDLSPHIMIL